MPIFGVFQLVALVISASLKYTRGPRQLGNSQSSLNHCMKLALVMASVSFLPHEKISIRGKVLVNQKFE